MVCIFTVDGSWRRIAPHQFKAHLKVISVGPLLDVPDPVPSDLLLLSLLLLFLPFESAPCPAAILPTKYATSVT